MKLYLDLTVHLAHARHASWDSRVRGGNQRQEPQARERSHSRYLAVVVTTNIPPPLQ